MTYIERIPVDRGATDRHRRKDSLPVCSPETEKKLGSVGTHRPLGAIVLGGAHGAIALARVLARQKLDVWFLAHDTPLPRFSRAVAHWRNWPGAEDPGAIDILEDIVRREKLEGYLLIQIGRAHV